MKKELDFSFLSNAYLYAYKMIMDADGYEIEHHPMDSPYRKLYEEFDIDKGKDAGILPIVSYRDLVNETRIIYLAKNYIDEVDSYIKKFIIYKCDKIRKEGYKFLYVVDENYKNSKYSNVFSFCSKNRLKNDVVNGGFYDENVRLEYIGISDWEEPCEHILAPQKPNIREYILQLKDRVFFNKFADKLAKHDLGLFIDIYYLLDLNLKKKYGYVSLMC